MNVDEVETILADFRAWLLEARGAPAPTPAEQLDIATVVQHFTAMRQEVNLQTKSSRSALEQNAQALALLQQSLESLQSQRTEEEDEGGQTELLRPLLKALVDAHDALSLAQREVQRLHDQPFPAPSPLAPPSAIEIRLPFWARWLGLADSIERQLAPFRKAHASTSPPADEYAARHRKVLDALLVGYRMSLQRIERTLEQQGLEPINCVGEPFDPETMEVAEVVREEGRTSTEVLQEIRRGYHWHGRLFRFAQVKVVASG